MTATEELVTHENRDGVTWVTIRRPEARNALTKAMYASLRDIARQAWVDDSIHAVVLQGSDGAFAVGGDLKEMLSTIEAGDLSKLLNYEDYLPFEALRSLPKPTIAMVDGLCLGGGLTLMLVCDMAVATTGSRFGIPEALVGIADGHTPRLLRDRVPPALLRYWLYTGVLFSAAEAQAAGLLTKVVDADALRSETEAILAKLRKSSPSAISLLKASLNETRPLPGMYDAHLTLLGDDALARIRAFAERSGTR